MREGKLYIDNKDAFIHYGVFIQETGYNGVLSYPPLKAPEVSNDWAEYDGIEVDLSDPKLDLKEFEIKFAAIGDYRTGDLFVLLSDSAYHTFEFREIQFTCRLRLVSEVSNLLYVGAKTFTLKFADDFPMNGYTYQAPSSNTVPIQGYEINGVDFSVYGIRVLEGSEAQVLKAPVVKKNMLRNLITENGAIYDGKNVVYQSKEVTLNCCLIANDLTEFWRNYRAFLHDLIEVVKIDEGDGVKVQTAEKTLFVDSQYEEYPCYYKNSKVSLFSPTGKLWCAFTLTLVFTVFRIGEDEYLLASEDGELIVTEDGEFYIDLKSYGN